jgi:hypothetical protein
VRRAILPIAAVLLTSACQGTTTVDGNVPRATAPVSAATAATAPVSPSPSPTPSASPSPTVSAPPAEPPTPTPAAPPTTRPALTNASAVVEQYYQDITDHDYADAWALGGSNIAGTTYSEWVAGFDTTANIDLGTISQFGGSQVRAVLYATQTDGTVKVFEGTYTVSNGVLVGASISQTS